MDPKVEIPPDHGINNDTLASGHLVTTCGVPACVEYETVLLSNSSSFSRWDISRPWLKLHVAPQTLSKVFKNIHPLIGLCSRTGSPLMNFSNR